MEFLPPEILHRLCDYFTVDELENTITLISKRWRDISNSVIRRRVLHLDLPDEIQKDLLPTVDVPQQVDTDYSPNEKKEIEFQDRLGLLKKFERQYFVNQVKLMTLNLKFADMQMWRRRFMLLRWMDCNVSQADLYPHLCFINDQIQYLPDYNLVLLCSSDEFYVIHPCSLFQIDNPDNLPDGYNGVPYPDDERFDRFAYLIKITDNITGKVSVFDTCGANIIHGDKEYLVIVEDHHQFRRPKLYKITSVHHTNRIVSLLFVGNLFLPATVRLIRVYRDRVFVLFTTGYVGIWCRDWGEDGIELVCSAHRISNPGSLDDAQILRIHNLFIIRSSASFYDMVDVTSYDVEVTRVPLLEILFDVFPKKGPFNDVLSIQCTGNVLLIGAKVKRESSRKKQILFVFKLERSPGVQDFATTEGFKSLINKEEISIYILELGHLIPIDPSCIPGRPDNAQSIKATFLKLIPPRLRSRRRPFLEIIDLMDHFTPREARHHVLCEVNLQ